MTTERIVRVVQYILYPTILTASILLRGLVLCLLWEWFLVPISTDVPPLGYTPAVGVVLLHKSLAGMPNPPRGATGYECLVVHLGGPLFTLGLGVLWHFLGTF